MMATIVLLGGNGYIGRNVTEEWLRVDPSATIYILSRSGKQTFDHPRVRYLTVDVTDEAAVLAVLPEQVDYIVDFIGRPEKDPQIFRELNDKPAQIMLEVARKKQVRAMGFIGGILGPRTFVEGKKRIADLLCASGIRTEVVEPTVVYGNGRADTLAKLIPVFKFLGLFMKNMKPVLVTDLSSQLVARMVKKDAH